MGRPGFSCEHSSAVEHYLHTVGVTGSNPVARTNSHHSLEKGVIPGLAKAGF